MFKEQCSFVSGQKEKEEQPGTTERVWLQDKGRHEDNCKH